MEALKAYCSNLLSEMEATLFEIRLEWPEPETWSKKSIPVVKGYLDKLKHYIIENPFKRRSEEIYFFKEVKPVFMGKLIFYAGVHNTETDRPAPTESNAEELDFLSNQISEHIEYFFNQNADLYTYYSEQRDELDSKLFVRNIADPFTFRELPIRIDPVSYYGDPDFSTGFDYLFAQFRGYEQLRDHLENEIEVILMVGREVPMEEMKFTGTPGDFVELVHMLKEIGKPVDPSTGLPATDEQVAGWLREMLSANWGKAEDFETLKAISGGSDLPERMLQSMERLRKKWDEEEGDKEYGNK